jgi:hypothetical protein
MGFDRIAWVFHPGFVLGPGSINGVFTCTQRTFFIFISDGAPFADVVLFNVHAEARI